MNKIIVSMFVSLDGRIEWKNKNERPPWSIIYWKDDLKKIMLDQVSTVSGLLLGRKTYEAFSKQWPTMKDESGYANLMNTLPKYIISSSLMNPKWNNSTIINDNIIQEIKNLKKNSNGDLLIFGSSNLISLLLKEEIIDEFRLFIIPFIIGSGTRLFNDGDTRNLTLIRAEKLSSDISYLMYRPKF